MIDIGHSANFFYSKYDSQIKTLQNFRVLFKIINFDSFWQEVRQKQKRGHKALLNYIET